MCSPLLTSIRNFPDISLRILQSWNRFFISFLSNRPQRLLLAKFVLFLLTDRKQRYSRDYQDKFVYFIFSEAQKCKLDGILPTFLELGADDGVRKSNCYYLEKRGWQGIAIEANPLQTTNLEQNRRCLTVKKAISINSTRVQFTVDLGHMSRSHIKFHDSYGNHFKESADLIDFFVETITPKEVMTTLKECNFLPLFYYSSDLEGIDVDILETFFSHKLFPLIISIEHNFDEMTLNSIRNIAFLQDYYEILSSVFRNDIVFISQELAEALGLKSETVPN